MGAFSYFFPRFREHLITKLQELKIAIASEAQMPLSNEANKHAPGSPTRATYTIDLQTLITYINNLNPSDPNLQPNEAPGRIIGDFEKFTAAWGRHGAFAINHKHQCGEGCEKINGLIEDFQAEMIFLLKATLTPVDNEPSASNQSLSHLLERYFNNLFNENVLTCQKALPSDSLIFSSANKGILNSLLKFLNIVLLNANLEITDNAIHVPNQGNYHTDLSILVAPTIRNVSDIPLSRPHSATIKKNIKTLQKPFTHPLFARSFAVLSFILLGAGLLVSAFASTSVLAVALPVLACFSSLFFLAATVSWFTQKEVIQSFKSPLKFLESLGSKAIRVLSSAKGLLLVGVALLAFTLFIPTISVLLLSPLFAPIVEQFIATGFGFFFSLAGLTFSSVPPLAIVIGTIAATMVLAILIADTIYAAITSLKQKAVSMEEKDALLDDGLGTSFSQYEVGTSFSQYEDSQEESDEKSTSGKSFFPGETAGSTGKPVQSTTGPTSTVFNV